MQLSLKELTELQELMKHLESIQRLTLGAITVYDSLDEPVGILSQNATLDWVFETLPKDADD